MKPKSLIFLVSSFVFCASAASAAPINTIANGDWSTATPWGSIPASGSDFRIDGENVNSPNATNNQTLTFAGDSLELAAGQLQLKLEHSDTRTANFNIANFTMSGGTLVFDASVGTSYWNLNTGIDFAASTTSTIAIRDGSYATYAYLKGALTGSGDIKVESNRSDTNDDRAYLYVNSSNNTFSGNWSAQGFDTGAWTNIRANAANALGTGTVTLLDRGALRVDAANGIDSTTGIILSHSTARLYLNNRNWTNAAGVLTVTDGIADIGTATVSIASVSQAAGTINLSVGGATSGKLALSGNANFTGGSIAVTLAGTPSGTYDLVTYGGSLVTAPTVNVTGDSGRLTPSVTNGSGTNDKVTLGFTGSVGNLTWKGNLDSNWNNNSTLNLDNGGTADVFRLFDNVTFDESATSFAPTLVGTLSAGTLGFANTTDYTIGGAGSLAGATTITKSGSGKLTIANTTANTFTGDISLSEGTLVAGSATALGAAVQGGGTFVTGTGTVDVNGFNLGAELIRIAGGGVGGNGAIVNSGASQTQALRFVTLTGDASVGGVNRWDIRGATTATLTLNNHKLTKVGDNYLAIVAANVTSGDIDVNAGTLGFSTTTTVNGTGTITANNGGTVEIGYGIAAANFTRDIVLNGGTLASVSTANGVNSNINLTADSTISTGVALTLNGNLTESGGARTLVKTGSSDLTVSGTGSTRAGETVIDNGYVYITGGNALGTGKITIGQTTVGGVNHGLRLNGVTIDNDVDSKYMWTGDYKGTITAVGGQTSTISGDVTILPNIAGASSRGGHLAGDATAGSVLRLMGELNAGGGVTVVTQRDGVVEYGGGSSTNYTLQVTNIARLAATNGIGSGVNVNLGVSGASTLDLNGFSTTVEAVTRAGNTTTITNNGGANATLTVSPAADRAYSGTITDGATNTVSLVKDGGFAYTLSGSNSYTGATTVSAGTLLVNGSLGNTATTVATGATLGGVGTIGGNTTINGTHSPGNSPGIQTFGAGLAYGSTAVLNWELTDNTTVGRGTTYDGVNVSGGSFSLDPAATMNLAFAGTVDFLDAFWTSDQEWLVVDLLGSATASDADLFTLGTINGGANYNPALGSFSIQRKDGATTEDAVYLAWVAVPEPGSVALSGLGALLLLRRRRSS